LSSDDFTGDVNVGGSDVNDGVGNVNIGVGEVNDCLGNVNDFTGDVNDGVGDVNVDGVKQTNIFLVNLSNFLRFLFHFLFRQIK
jgi:hypothetical protein